MSATLQQAIQIVRGIVGLINNQDLTIAGLENLITELKTENSLTKEQLSSTIATYEAALTALKEQFASEFAADEAADEAELQAEKSRSAGLESELAETEAEKAVLESEKAELQAEVENLKAILDRLAPAPTPDPVEPPVEEVPAPEQPVDGEDPVFEVNPIE